jgi:hypothetical protein
MSETLSSRVTPNPPLPPTPLSKGALRTLRALVVTLTPETPAVPHRVERVCAFATDYLSYLPELLRRLFPLGLWLFEWGPLFFSMRRRFSCLGTEERLRYVVSWQRSRFALKRQLVRGLRTLVLMGYYDLPEVQHFLAFEPASFVDSRVRDRREAYARRGLPFVIEPHATDSDMLDRARPHQAGA